MYTSFFNFLNTILYWSIADEQCCNSFRWTAKGLSHTNTGSSLPQTPLPSNLPHNIEQNSPCNKVSPCWLSIINIAAHT